MVKNLLAKQETCIGPLGLEESLEKEITTNSLPGEFHGQRSLGSYSPWGCKELDTTKQLTHSPNIFHFSQPVLFSSFFNIYKYVNLLKNGAY